MANITILDTCTLLPNSKRLKQLISEHGKKWVVISDPVPMQCFDNSDGVMIESMNRLHTRNARLTDLEF